MQPPDDKERWHDFKPDTLGEFLAREFPPREYILAPLLPTQGSSMVHAYRGVGKTHFSIGCAVAVATGTRFLKFDAPKARRVYLVDGEMPGNLLQSMVATAIRRLPDGVSTPEPDTLRILTPDILPGAIPNLATPEGQSAIEAHLDGAEHLILDNISTLFRGGGRENDEDSWVGAQEWIIKLRRWGVSTQLVHHDGKGLAQRGTSKREDILDSVISLKRPDDYNVTQGARFECHFEKARGFLGPEAAPFEAWLQGEAWTIKDVEDPTLDDAARVTALQAGGLSIRDIAKATGLDRSKVHRLIKNHGGNGSDA